MYSYSKFSLPLSFILLGISVLPLAISGCESSIGNVPKSSHTANEQELNNTSKDNAQSHIETKEVNEKWHLFKEDSNSKYYINNKPHLTSPNAKTYEIEFKRTYTKNQKSGYAAAPYIYEQANLEINCNKKQVATQSIAYYDWLGRIVNKSGMPVSDGPYSSSVTVSLVDKYCAK